MKKIIIPLFVSFLLISCGKSEEIKQESSVNTTKSGVIQTGSIETGSNTNTGVINEKGTEKHGISGTRDILDKNNKFLFKIGIENLGDTTNPKVSLYIIKDGKKNTIDDNNEGVVSYELSPNNKFLLYEIYTTNPNINIYDINNNKKIYSTISYTSGIDDKEVTAFNCKEDGDGPGFVDIIDLKNGLKKNLFFSNDGTILNDTKSLNLVQSSIINCGKLNSTNNSFNFSLKDNKTGNITNYSYLFESGKLITIKESNNVSPISFSDSQIKDILSKIDENTKKQQELEKNSTGSLIQGDFKAEYISNNFDINKADSFIITKNGISKTLPGLYNPNSTDETDKSRQKEFNLLQSKDFIGNDQKDKIEKRWVSVGLGVFNGFVEFSPSGNYILYNIGSWGGRMTILMDTQTGKEVIKELDMGYHDWTIDKKRFIYGTTSGIVSGKGLLITKKGAFPEVETIEKDDVIGGYVDNNYIYTKVSINGVYLKIYDLNTLKEVFSKEIQ